ncbi:LAS seventeen-binding protein 1/2, partial [Phenoliferia sp. Uapishka_3]
MALPTSYTHHLLTRVLSDLSFLTNSGVLSPSALAAIKSHLPFPSLPPTLRQVESSPEEQVASGSAPPRATGAQRAVPPPPPRKASGLSSNSVRKVRCEAVWDYPREQPQRDDLHFKAGDIIILEEEMNPDWWRGSIDERIGLFPANSNFDLHNTTTSPSPSPSSPSHYIPNVGPGYNSEKSPQEHQPPQSYHPPQPQQPFNQAPQPPPQPPSSNKYKKFGGQMGMSVARGAGFGAGVALAVDAVNSIF